MKTESFYFESRDIGTMCLEDVIEGGKINMVDPNGGAHIPTPKLTDPKVKLKKRNGASKCDGILARVYGGQHHKKHHLPRCRLIRFVSRLSRSITQRIPLAWETIF